MSSLMIRRMKPWRTELSFALYAVVAVVVASLCVVLPASAAENKSGAQITMSPASQKLELVPGETYSGSFTVINDGETGFDFKVYASPYQVKDRDYQAIFNKETPRTQISRWVKLDRTEYTLEPKAKQEVPFSVTTPANMPDGGQYAVLFAETIASKEGTSIAAQRRVGSILYASADGKTNEQGSAKTNQISFFQMNKSITSETEVTNTGNTDFATNFTFVATDPFGNQKFKASKTAVTLPETTRVVPMQWPDAHGFGLFKLTTTASLLGKETTSTSWVLRISPLAALIAFVLVALAIGGVVYANKNRRPATKRRK